MMNAGKTFFIRLLFALLLSAPTICFSGENAGFRGDKVLLSLRIAKARKEQHGISYYKSVARQMKLRRPATAPRPSSSRSPSGSSRGAR